MKRLGIKLDGDELYEEFQRIYDERVSREKISKEVKRSIELYGNNPSFLVGIIRLAIKALELLISKVLLAAAKVAKKIVDVVHEKVVEKEVPVLVEEPEQAVEII